jgi:hypothetical protein
MIRDRTRSALETRAKEQRPTGGKCYGYRDGAVLEAQAALYANYLSASRPAQVVARLRPN